MSRPSYRLCLGLLVALLASSSLANLTAAAPGVAGIGPLLQTGKAAKEQQKQEAQVKKDAAEAEKQRRKCVARGNWPCSPTVTLSWLKHERPSVTYACHAVVTVTGFAPDTYDWFPSNAAGPIDIGIDLPPLIVDSTGNGSQSSGTVGFSTEFEFSVTVGGITTPLAYPVC